MTRTRFQMLDGLRGIAALAVFGFHYSTDLFGHMTVLHGYLAVDLFFILSGVVIAQAYDDRLADGMSLREFTWARLRRLYPVYAIGLALGWVVSGGPAAQVVATSVFLPAPSPGLPDLYGLNIVFWSLGLEVLANLAYAAGRRWASTPALAAVVAGAAVALIWAGVLHGDVDGGAYAGDFWVGLARVLFGFPLGVLVLRLYRAGRLPKVPAGVTPAALVCAAGAALLAPGPVDLPLVLVVFPVLVAWAMQVEPSAVEARWFAVLAWLSYPLYAVHEPVHKLFQQQGWPIWLAVVCALGAAVLTGWLERVIRKAPAVMIEAGGLA